MSNTKIPPEDDTADTAEDMERNNNNSPMAQDEPPSYDLSKLVTLSRDLQTAMQEIQAARKTLATHEQRFRYVAVAMKLEAARIIDERSSLAGRKKLEGEHLDALQDTISKKLEDIYAGDPELLEAKKKAVDEAIAAHREGNVDRAKGESGD